MPLPNVLCCVCNQLPMPHDMNPEKTPSVLTPAKGRE